MGFFDKIIAAGTGLFAKKTTPDLSFGLISQLQADELLRAEKWTEFESAVLALSSENLTRLLDGLCVTMAHHELLKKYISSGHSEVRELVAGAHHLFLAWESRSGNLAAELNQDQVDGFFHYLNEANANFAHEFSTRALEAESFARLVRVYMGFSDTEAAQAAFDNATQLVPGHLLAYLNYFKLITPRWLGDADTLRRFIDAPASPEIKKLLQLMFLVEMYSDAYNENQRAARLTLQTTHTALLNEVLATAQPAPGDSLLAIYTNNYLACLYKILGHSKEEAEVNKLLVNRRTLAPWQYF